MDREEQANRLALDSGDAYPDKCWICGLRQVFSRDDSPLRESYRCARCEGSLREREQAGALLRCYAYLGCGCLADLVTNSAFRRLSVYEPGTIGPFRPQFRRLPAYQQSDYYAPSARVDAPPSIPHEDLEALTFSDESFDLVVTSDIFEHVREPARALAEIARVLRPGGHHVFTVPMLDPIPRHSIWRVDTSGEADIPVLPEVYHGNGKGGRSLVYTDFGLDIADMHGAVGLSCRFIRPRTPVAELNRIVTIVGRRPHSARSRVKEMAVRIRRLWRT
ncbi:MAG: class I SAM-dependent methyltransferase [Gammaproteobacteria bacterium]